MSNRFEKILIICIFHMKAILLSTSLFERIKSHICQMKLVLKLSEMIFTFFYGNQIL